MRTAPLAVAAVAAAGGSLLLSPVVGRASAPGLWDDVIVAPKAGAWALVGAVVVLLIVTFAALGLLLRNARFGRTLACSVGLLAFAADVVLAGAAAPMHVLRGLHLTSCGDVSYAHSPEFEAFVTRVEDRFDAAEYRIEASWRTDYREIPAPVLGPRGPSPQLIACEQEHPRSAASIYRTQRGVFAANTVWGWSLVWDSKSGKALWDEQHRTSCLLAMLDPDAEPEDQDVRAVAQNAECRRREVRSGSRNCTVRPPSEDDVLAAMNDGRTSVQEAARTIALAGGPEVYPRATALFAASRPK